MADPVEVLKALAEPTRLRIMTLLARGDELCVCELMAVLDLPQYAVSRYLGTLRNAGLIESRRDRQWVYYRLQDDLGQFETQVLGALRALAEPDDIARLDEQMALRLEEPCCEVPRATENRSDG